MASLPKPRFPYRRPVSNDRNLVTPSLVVHINQSGIATAPPKDYAYRTELYLQQRQQLRPPSTTTTTWKALTQQKQINHDDQVEIDRVLTTLDSIHDTLNRSLMRPYSRVYSTLYGDGDEEDASTRLMRTFCQRQDHLRKEENTSCTQETSSSLGIFPDTDSDASEAAADDERKNSYDSGYGSILPRRKPIWSEFFLYPSHCV